MDRGHQLGRVRLIAVAASVLVGGGWALILLELAGLGLLLFF